ncbi:MAG TPA: alpha/beta fold hydrolase [Steroidobacteraceae bacterium]|nr:alpha/beta fold hydrolase [Steroidobacteraceae bacterium]
MPERYVIFSHGRDSEPWSRKLTGLAEIARTEGYHADSLDYRGIDHPRDRVTKLVEHCQKLPGELVLAGSSLGGYVTVAAASLLHARGVFLLAPALLMEGLPPLREGLIDCPTTIVHGWRDTVVPPEHSVQFARQYRATLHLLDTDHRMYDQLQTINYYFEHFLVSIDMRYGYR